MAEGNRGDKSWATRRARASAEEISAQQAAGAKKRWEKEKDNTAPAEIRKKFSEMGKKSSKGGFGANPELARQVKREYWAKKRAEKEATEKKTNKLLGIIKRKAA